MYYEKGYRIESSTYLHAGPESQVGIAGVAHLEDTTEPILGKVADLEDLELRGHGAEVEFGDEDIIDDNRGLRRLVEGGGEQIPGARVEVGVGRQRRPVEVEGHDLWGFVGRGVGYYPSSHIARSSSSDVYGWLADWLARTNRRS